MTRWRFNFELIDDDGKITSRVKAEFDDEKLGQIQTRLREFLRGCGYSVPEPVEDEVPDVDHENQ